MDLSLTSTEDLERMIQEGSEEALKEWERRFDAEYPDKGVYEGQLPLL